MTPRTRVCGLSPLDDFVPMKKSAILGFDTELEYWAKDVMTRKLAQSGSSALASKNPTKRDGAATLLGRSGKLQSKSIILSPPDEVRD